MTKKRLSKSAKIERQYKKDTKGTKLGSGKRFSAMTKALKKKGAKNPNALAAWIGRKKLGSEKMTKLSVVGRKRATAKRKRSK